MADLSFYIVATEVLTGNASVALKHTVSRNEQLLIHGMFMDSTGAFEVTDISDDSGRNYTNANASTPIPSKFFQDPDTHLDRLQRFEPPILIDGGDSFNVGVADTTGSSNTVTLILQATRVLG